MLSEGDREAILPRDEDAARILEAAYPLLLLERSFHVRFLAGSSPDARRLLGLAEILLQRLQAAAVLMWSAFDRAREIGAVLDVASSASRALSARVTPELALLAAAAWSWGLRAPPRATLAAAALGDSWREEFDADFWRNPRFAEPLRRLASRAARESLEEVLPAASAAGSRAYPRWVFSVLGD